MLIGLFLIQLLMCIAATVVCQVHGRSLSRETMPCIKQCVLQLQARNVLVKHYYLKFSDSDIKLEGVRRFFTYVILMAQMVPISFVVSVSCRQPARNALRDWPTDLNGVSQDCNGFYGAPGRRDERLCYSNQFPH